MPLNSVKALYDGLKFTVPAESCTEPQVEALEKKLGFALPPNYREFLLWMGQSPSGILFGSSWLPDDLPDLKPALIKFLAANNFPEKLPDDAFVFWENQGYVYTFLRLSQGDASPVYRYHGTLETTTFTAINPSYESWLAQQIQEHVERMKSFGKPW